MACIACEGRPASLVPAPPTPDVPDEGCVERRPPPRLGVVDAIVDDATAQRLVEWRRQFEEERMLEELNPALVRASLRLEQSQIARGCLDLDATVDVGRALFLRNFTTEDGWGHQGAALTRVQRDGFGGPDALSCQGCHWKGGAGGAGDRVDNAYLFGDGDDVAAADARNPPALWGAGWIEVAAAEISADLQAQAVGVRRLAGFDGTTVTRPLASKGISFGSITATPDGTIDTSGVVGIDHDLVVKPFGWKGTSTTLREFVRTSLHLHLGMQAEEIVAGVRDPGPQLGDGPDDDPDHDGVTREITEGELTALVAYLATLDVPPLAALDEGPYREPELFSNELEIVRSPEFTSRWLDGFSRFGRLGCAQCHVPFVRVDDPRYRTRSPLSGHETVIDLAADGARPTPSLDDDGRYLIPAFTDFKRHDMGAALTGRADEGGVARSVWMTRRLWGLASTSPYLHDGSAMTFDEAIARHGGDAAQAQRAYALLDEGERTSVRIFLASLARAPSIRIR
jgi:hypothetical protein